MRVDVVSVLPEGEALLRTPSEIGIYLPSANQAYPFFSRDGVMTADGSQILGLGYFGEKYLLRIVGYRRWKARQKVALDRSLDWIAASSDFGRIYGGCAGGTELHEIDPASLKIVKSHDLREPTKLSALAMQISGDRLLTGWDDGKVRIYQAEGLKLLATLDAGGPVKRILVSRDGATVAVQTAKGYRIFRR